MAAKIYLAREASSLRIFHIDEVDKETKREFKCLGCGEDLTPVKSAPRLRDWHYRHIVRSICRGAKDRALHDFAVQILVENKSLAILEDLFIEYTDPRKELAFFDYRSDVAVRFENRDVHFEVFVTNDLSNGKAKCYRDNKIRCVKIDLSPKSLQQESSERIRYEVLENLQNRAVIFWKDPENAPGPSDPPDNTLMWIAAAVAAFFGLKTLVKHLNVSSRSNNKNKRPKRNYK